MKLFLRGGVGLVAALFAFFLIFYARPLIAEDNPSPQPATQEQQQEKQEPAPAAQQKKEAEATATAPATAPTETAKLSETVIAAPSEPEIRSPESLALSAPEIYNATSYSRPGRGASGMGVRFGTIAADPKVLPFGTRVRLDAGQYSGEYLVTDSGTAIKGRKIDIWLPSFREACRFGRRNVKLTVLSYGGRRRAKRAR